MIFEEKEDVPEYLISNRRVDSTGTIEIFTYQVLFGWRVRAGYVGEWATMLDWCGGGNWESVTELYSIAMNVLSSRESHEDVFAGLPRISDIKPYVLDHEFCKKIASLCVGEVIPVPIRQTNFLRTWPHV